MIIQYFVDSKKRDDTHDNKKDQAEHFRLEKNLATEKLLPGKSKA